MPLSHFSTMDLKSIVASGGGLTLDAKSKTVTEFKLIAASASSSNVRITIRGLETFSVTEVKSIAASGKGCVSFE
jgi:hypothetical protein